MGIFRFTKIMLILTIACNHPDQQQPKMDTCLTIRESSSGNGVCWVDGPQMKDKAQKSCQ
jgi:hypothetical protein